MIEKNTREPFINIWFGNFYKPAFDDKEFVKAGIKMLREMGFNGIQLDSKAWEDFRERFNNGEASDYVAQQEYMMEQCGENGIGYNFMSLYLCADNLYPNIRFSPPIFGESVVNPDGSDGRWYRYWSDKAKDSMTEHLKGLFKTYGDGVSRAEINGREVMPTCTMWDPIVAPSFDEDGRARYLGWLEKNYGSIDKLNSAYHTEFESFSELNKEDYWFTCKYNSLYTKEELDKRSPKALLWADNMKWRIHELCEYFKDMNERIHKLDERIYTMPDMAQWSYFLNIDATQLSNVGLSDLWDTSNRGLDIYKLSKYVDCCNFTAVPITPYGDPDAYVLAAQHSMMRAMNKGREFMGGVYYGRFLYNNIYEFLTPAEIIGSITASGASGYNSYGMCGLDDGGVLHRMDKGFNKSLSIGNEWAKKVIPIIKGERKCPVAILFPSAMSAYEPMGVEGNKERRYDLLGYYKMCSDAGFGCDIISADMIAEGVLKNYKALIIPENDCYFLDNNSAAEEEVRVWVNDGGVVIHSPMDGLVENCFGIKGIYHDKDAFEYVEKGLAQSDLFVSYEGESIAKYLTDGANAAAKNKIGKGAVYSMGFAYGYSFSAKIAPHVPLNQKNNELYPVPLMKNNIVADILRNENIEHSDFCGTNIETAEFDNCIIAVNHTSHPLVLTEKGEKIFQYAVDGTTLMPRSAVLIMK
ncbi:MAG: beta-galactosidase [bacterium]|nr:beta-galactosidase [bacterium]